MSNDRINKEFLIDRYGKCIKLKGSAVGIYSIHEEIAKQQFPSIPDAYYHVVKLGWVIVGSDIFGVPTCFSQPSQAQVNKVDLLFGEEINISAA